MPRITESFTLPRPLPQVWATLQDIPRVVTCLPGLELTGQPAEQVYAGRLKVRLGAVTAAFEGEATITAIDPAAHETRLKGKGTDRKGGSRAQAEFVYRLEEVPAGTRVAVDADITLSGPLAQFGRTGILQDVARELTAQFATNLEAMLAAAPAAAPPPVATADDSPPAPRADAPPPAAPLSGTRLLWVLLKGRWRAFARWCGFGAHDG